MTDRLLVSIPGNPGTVQIIEDPRGSQIEKCSANWVVVEMPDPLSGALATS